MKKDIITIIAIFAGTIFIWAGWTLILSFNVLNILFGVISILFGLSPLLIIIEKDGFGVLFLTESSN